MATKYLDSNGLLYLWGKIKSAFVGNVSYNSTTKNLVLTKNGTDSNIVTLITQEDIPEGALPSTTTPKMDGTATIGSETTFARGDHIHPSDTSKVDKVTGKGLSTNDYTTAEQTKLSGIATGAQVNVLEGVQVNGTDLTITNKKVNIPVFTGATVDADGTVGLVPANTAGGHTNYLLSNGGWKSLGIGNATATHEDENFRIALALNGTSISYHDIRKASTTKAGVMTASDKTKLDSIIMANGVIDSSCLPSFVDDVIEAYARSGQTELSSTWLATGSASGTVITPETGKIYVLMNDSTSYSANSQFRWGGTAYVKLNDGGVTAITNAEIDVIVAS